MRISFFGGGNMASAMIGGLLARGHAAGDIYVVEISADARERLKREFSVGVGLDNANAAGADVVVLAVKPQQLEQLARELTPLLKNQLVFSIAAGISTGLLQSWLNGNNKIVRAMPNTPAQIQAGLTGLFAMPAVDAAGRSAAETIAEATGDYFWVDSERAIDAVTALSGSGPAYVFYFIEAMQQAAENLGFDPALARRISNQTFLGASLLASHSAEDAATLRQRVTSKGGTTERALETLEAAAVKQHFVAAIEAAYQRAVQLGDPKC